MKEFFPPSFELYRFKQTATLWSAESWHWCLEVNCDWAVLVKERDLDFLAHLK